jgi:hypothetical protein
VFAVISAFSAYNIFSGLTNHGSMSDIVRVYSGLATKIEAEQWLAEQKAQARFEAGYMGPGLVARFHNLPGRLLNFALLTYIFGLGMSSLLPFAVSTDSRGRDSSRNVSLDLLQVSLT